MSEHKPIRVMVVDDHLVVRHGFSTFLKAFKDLEMVGEASNGVEAVQCCGDLRPDVILMDMMMPEMDGLDATRTIRRQHPQVQVIALTSFTDDKQLVQSALEAGAIGYLFKDVSVTDLAKAIRMAYEGLPVLSPEATRMLIQAKMQRSPHSFNLSERELDVLRLLVEGLSNAEIALRLSISRSTIKFHVSSILGKLGAASRTEAVTIAYQNKLVT
jgi:NarL family two-component system response regulator LiaR